MEGVPMYVEGNVTKISKSNGYYYVVITTSQGKIAIIDVLKQDGFRSLKKGDAVAPAQNPGQQHLKIMM